MLLQLTILTSHVGILIWNSAQESSGVKILQDFGDMTLYVGIASSSTSFVLDILLLSFAIRDCEVSLYWWSFACIAFAVPSWTAYLAITLYIRNLSLGMWSFFWLYCRVGLLMVVKADYLDVWKSNTPSTNYNDLQFSPPSSPGSSTVTSYHTTLSSLARPQAPLNDSRKFDITQVNRMKVDAADYHSKLTFCTFLGDSVEFEDEYDSKSLIKVNEERKLEELKTPM